MGIPDRWIPYSACGEVIEGTKIICFKVPLKEEMQQRAGVKEIWDIKALLSRVPGLGAVIDLTNTRKYYKPQELESAGVLHKKILIPGRVIPPVAKLKEFVDAINEFQKLNSNMIIGVHCTHGLNRTGYMVCRYMSDQLGIAPGDAIQRFEEARGYKIERDNYLADILGKIPPPPDVGKYTEIKPLNGYNECPDKSENRRYKNKNHDRELQYNWREREDFEKNDKEEETIKNERSEREKDKTEMKEKDGTCSKKNEKASEKKEKDGTYNGGEKSEHSEKSSYFGSHKKRDKTWESRSNNFTYDYRYDY